MHDKDHYYHSATEDLENARRRVQEIEIALAHYPDLEVAYSQYAPESTPGYFVSPSIFRGDVQIHYVSHTWNSLSFQLHVTIPSSIGDIKVYHPACIFKCFDYNKSTIVTKRIYSWQFIDRKLDQLGFSPKIYEKVTADLIKFIAEQGCVDSINGLVLTKDLPEKIQKLMVFI